MILRTTAAVLALVVVLGAARNSHSAPASPFFHPDSIPVAKEGGSRSDSGGIASAVAGAKADSIRNKPGAVSGKLDSSSSRSGHVRDTSALGKHDSGAVGDSASRSGKKGLTDSAAAPRKRELPPRTLTLRQQVMFAGGFMTFIALMMTSMQNFNP